MASKLVTDVLGLTKYSEVDMPEELNVLSTDMQIVDNYANEVNTWRNNTDATIEQMQSDIAVLQPEVITALENKVNTNAINIANHGVDISVLRQRADGADDRLDAIEAEQIVQNTDISDIKTEQIVQNNAISALGDDITTLQNEVTTYETATDDRLDSIESDIATLKTEDETITAQLALDATELADHEERIGALEGGGTSTIPQRVTDLETEVGVLDTAVQGLGTDMDNAESAIGTLQTSVNTLTTSTIPTIQSKVNTNSNLISVINDKLLRVEEFDYIIGTVSANALTQTGMSPDELYHSLAGDNGYTAAAVFMYCCYGNVATDIDAKLYPDMQNDGDLVIKTTVAQTDVTAVLWFFVAKNPY